MTNPEKQFFKHDIVYFEQFVSPEDSVNLVEYFKQAEPWNRVAFFGSWGMSLAEEDPALEKFNLPKDYFVGLTARLKAAVEDAHNVETRVVSTHAQKWETGAYANWHSDNSSLDGTPSAWEVSKYVCLLYLNEDYGGGELAFRDHNLTISPSTGMLVTFPGGIDNVHGVNEVTSGIRWTIGAFWDRADAIYSDERRQEWADERAFVKQQQEVQYAEWEKNGN